VPEPLKPEIVPLPTLTSLDVKPVTDFENVAVTEKAAFVGSAAADESATVGAASSVMDAVAVVEMLPAASLYCAQTVFAPSPLESVKETVVENEAAEATVFQDAAEQSEPSA